MTKYYVFQINADTDFRLSQALEAMKKNKEDVLWLNQKSHQKKTCLLNPTDVVYLWESGIPKPRHLVARGEVSQAERLGKDVDMPAWQQAFYLDGCASRIGPTFHKSMPRVQIRIDKWLAPEKRVDRARTSSDMILRQRSFLNSASNKFRGVTIFDLTEKEAQALDQLACW